jgi:hypothetical protein
MAILAMQNEVWRKQLRPRVSFAGTKFGGGGKRGRAKIHSPQRPFLFARPSVQFWFCRASRGNGSVPLKKGSRKVYNYSTLTFLNA